MTRGLALVSVLYGALVLFGCSAIVQPDTSRLGTDVDAGHVDHDVGIGEDTGVLDDAAPTDDGGDDTGPATCTGGPTCEGGVASRCERGMRTMETCALGCAAGLPRCTQLAPSNVSAMLFDPAALDVRLTADATLDTDMCHAPMATSRVVMQDDGSEVCAVIVRGFAIANGSTLRVVGTRPLVVLASGAVQIDGVIDASAVLEIPGAGGGRGGLPRMSDGEGAAGGHAGAEESFSDGGGGGGGNSSNGGNGGSGGSASGGDGGGATGPDDLIPLRGGSGGGMGLGSAGMTRLGNLALGGAGGGAIQISSQVSIAVSGAILAAGGGGHGGGNDTTVGIGNFAAGAGGGSGGGILLEAPMLDITGRLSTTGGAGGGGGSTGAAGGNGADGRDAAGAAVGGASGGAGYGALGGDSGALDAPDGSNGDDNGNANANGGGGGGSAGRIVLRDTSGSYAPAASAFISPSGSGLNVLMILTR